MQQEYFGLYLKNVKKVKEATQEHYFQSLRKITALLREVGYPDIESLYDVDSYSQLQEIKQALKEDPGFVALDERGHRMYSAGFNRYMEFAEGKDFLMHPSSLSLIDCPCPVKQPSLMKQTFHPSRDRIMVRQVFQASEYHCEINTGHKTFLAQASGRQYVEGHHLIPLEVQPEIVSSLDVYANIITLCPTCHRFLHFGMQSDKEKVLSQLFETRQDRLNDSGIKLGKKEFLELVEPTKAYAG
ncbi:HNH endonuclease [uncultured Sphaerochaeta sp.]|uniref:HNH endonuclease n=1 Tax=uncultured Sphaerochaeta sp. TaxID=886478 RepID=UPI002A0A8755|nr:HNH endonuclease [uncultured Sphaerochaeta sp.]